MEHKKIIIIDAIVMSFFSYLYISQLPSDLTFFQQIVITGIVFLAFIFFMRFPVIGRILQLLASIVWVMVIIIIIPFEDLTNNNQFWMTGIVVVLFMLFLCFHRILVQDLFDILNELKRKKGITEQESAPHGEKEFISYEEGMLSKILNMSEYGFTKNFDGLIRECYYVCSVDSDKILEIKLFPDTNRIGKLFQVMEISIRDMYGEILKIIDNRVGYEDFIQKVSQLEKDFKFSSICRRYNSWKWAWLYLCDVRGFASKSSDKQGNQIKDDKNESDMYLELFNGCDDIESITFRYRQLMKVYHPDNKNGDNKMATKIKMTYDMLKGKY